MKHAELHAIVHNVADSLASGCSLLIGFYELDVFGEAARSRTKAISVDLLSGSVVEGEPSPMLVDAVQLYPAALARLCADAGGSIDEIKTAVARFWSEPTATRFSVSVGSRLGHCTTIEYGGMLGQHLKQLDHLGRLRPKPRVTA